jgi:trimethylamine--corrinoid protein Co-methyltransferase
MNMQIPELHFKPKLQVINDDQIRQIHMATLEVLERTGVKMTHPRALELLDGAGARVEGDRVRMPAWMVEDAINGERCVFLEEDKSWFGPSLDCIDYLDPITDARSRFTSEHCRITATLADALPNFHWSMIIGMADDQPPDICATGVDLLRKTAGFLLQGYQQRTRYLRNGPVDLRGPRKF